MSTDTFVSADSFLMGGGTPSAKFLTIGSLVKGAIVDKPIVSQQNDYTTRQPKFWDNGTPMLQLVVILQTEERDPTVPDDTGRRSLYIKGGLQGVIKDAVKAAGARGLEVGGTLAVKYVSDGVAQPRMNAPKVFQAQYTAPTAGADFFDSPAQAATAQTAASTWDAAPPF